jgi:hypothetical protein
MSVQESETEPVDRWHEKHPICSAVYLRPAPWMKTVRIPVDVRHFAATKQAQLEAWLWSRPYFKNQMTQCAMSVPGALDLAALYVTKWVASNIRYLTDPIIGGLRYWLYPHETMTAAAGGDIDGSLLQLVVCRIVGIPANRVRVNVGYVNGRGKAGESIHAWMTYRRQSDNHWVPMDWCWRFSTLHPKRREKGKNLSDYCFNDKILVSFNDDYCWGENPVTLKDKTDEHK